MHKITKVSISVLILLTAACSKNMPVHLGDETVIIKRYAHGEGKAFVHLHQNEKTALDAAKYVMRKEGGSVLTLAHSGERNVVFHLDNERYEFDPNRIFSNVGIRHTLSKFGHYTARAHQEVVKLAEKIKSQLPPGKVIAVHNNKQQYSFKAYWPGQSLSQDVRVLHLQDKDQYRNFFLVTRMQDFLRLKDLQFNSVLQVKHPEDDGSLSVFLTRRQYINVEAGYDQLQAQIKMLSDA